jgi:hypothetical protein
MQNDEMKHNLKQQHLMDRWLGDSMADIAEVGDDPVKQAALRKKLSTALLAELDDPKLSLKKAQAILTDIKALNAGELRAIPDALKPNDALLKAATHKVDTRLVEVYVNKEAPLQALQQQLATAPDDATRNSLQQQLNQQIKATYGAHHSPRSAGVPQYTWDADAQLAYAQQQRGLALQAATKTNVGGDLKPKLDALNASQLTQELTQAEATLKAKETAGYQQQQKAATALLDFEAKPENQAKLAEHQAKVDAHQKEIARLREEKLRLQKNLSAGYDIDATTKEINKFRVNPEKIARGAEVRPQRVQLGQAHTTNLEALGDTVKKVIGFDESVNARQIGHHISTKFDSININNKKYILNVLFNDANQKYLATLGNAVDVSKLPEAIQQQVKGWPPEQFAKALMGEGAEQAPLRQALLSTLDDTGKQTLESIETLNKTLNAQLQDVAKSQQALNKNAVVQTKQNHKPAVSKARKGFDTKAAKASLQKVNQELADTVKAPVTVSSTVQHQAKLATLAGKNYLNPIERILKVTRSGEAPLVRALQSIHAQQLVSKNPLARGFAHAGEGLERFMGNVIGKPFEMLHNANPTLGKLAMRGLSNMGIVFEGVRLGKNLIDGDYKHAAYNAVGTVGGFGALWLTMSGLTTSSAIGGAGAAALGAAGITGVGLLGSMIIPGLVAFGGALLLRKLAEPLIENSGLTNRKERDEQKLTDLANKYGHVTLSQQLLAQKAAEGKELKPVEQAQLQQAQQLMMPPAQPTGQASPFTLPSTGLPATATGF